jgi:hypothetical protein
MANTSLLRPVVDFFDPPHRYWRCGGLDLTLISERSKDRTEEEQNQAGLS